MLEKLESDSDVVAVRLSGRLTDDDYMKRFIPEIQKAIDAAGMVKVLIILEDFHGWQISNPLEGYLRGIEHRGSIDRIALVGDDKWMSLMRPFMRAFTKGEVRHFSSDQTPDAWRWVREPAAATSPHP